jgi:hypothetical protein
MLVRNSAFWNIDHPRNRKRSRLAASAPVYWDWTRTGWIIVKTDNPRVVELGKWADDLTDKKSFTVHQMGLFIMPHFRTYKRKCGERKKPKSNKPRQGRQEFVIEWK